MGATLDGAPVPRFAPVAVAAGGVAASSGAVRGAGSRAYLAVRGGIDVPAYLGSRATFTLGGFGGHGGRALRAGDVLHVGAQPPARRRGRRCPSALIPHADATTGRSACSYGPHGAPDFFTDDDIDDALRDRRGRSTTTRAAPACA